MEAKGDMMNRQVRELTKDEHMIRTGQYIRQKRIQADYSSLRQFARHLGLSASYVSDIERGRRPISHKLAAKLSDALEEGHSVDDAGPTVYDSILILNGTISPERVMLLDTYSSLMKKEPDNFSADDIFFALWNNLSVDVEAIEGWFEDVEKRWRKQS